MTADEYVEERLDDQIDWYDRKSIAAQRNSKGMRITEIICAASIPLLSGFVDPERPAVGLSVGILGAVVAVLAGALGLYQFEQLRVQYRTICESLKKEKYLFLTRSAPYGGKPAQDYRRLVQRGRDWSRKRTPSGASS